MTITLISASFLGLLMIYLTMGVAKNRGRSKIDLGTGDDEELLIAVRAHGNFTEFAPLGLILIGLLEYSRVSWYLVMGIAVAFVVGRYMHGLTFGKFEGRNPYRFVGTLLTLLSILVASVAGLLKGYGLM
ncbi:MAPEG family protein [Kordiimonas aquimaris]|uniref:MAPEG family protein n=1 Tax=Kordiimonas aquimaris TaxID=707591 RepID=UPI0021CF9E67|nr:MAPEG family protein [Kordiimonas aquimaris]